MPQSHVFSVYAPTVDAISCTCSAWPGESRPMVRGDDGMWTLPADLPDGIHTYTYRLRSRSWFARDQEVEINDPLARFLAPDQRSTAVVIPPPPLAESYVWRHDALPHPEHGELAIYEVFIADLAADGRGTFADLTARLPHLAGLGFTAIELLPLTTADDTKGWGYTPSFFFAVEPRFGSEAELCRLVDEAHGHGLAVIFDGVYNHASRDCPLAHIDHDCYFHHAPKDPDVAWGPQFNYAMSLPGTDEFPARRFIKSKVAHWIREFHFDGIRYDAVSQLRDREFLGELTDWTRDLAGAKPFFAIAECLPLDPALVGINGPMDAWWREEFSQRVRSLLAGDWNGDALEGCIDCRRDGFPSGRDVVNYLASHDTGYTVRHLLERGLDEPAALYRMRLGLVLLFTSVGLPMVWMGDELGCAGATGASAESIPWAALAADPRRADLQALTARLLALRKAHGALRGDGCTTLLRDDDRRLLVVVRWDEAGGRVLIAIHGGDGDVDCRVTAPCPGRWREHVAEEAVDTDPDGGLAFTLGGWEARVWTPA